MGILQEAAVKRKQTTARIKEKQQATKMEILKDDSKIK